MIITNLKKCAVCLYGGIGYFDGCYHSICKNCDNGSNYIKKESYKTEIKKIMDGKKMGDRGMDDIKNKVKILQKLDQDLVYETARKVKKWKEKFDRLSYYTEVTGEISCFVKRKWFTLNKRRGLSYFSFIQKGDNISIYKWGCNFILKVCDRVYEKMYRKLTKKIDKRMEIESKEKIDTSKYCPHCGVKNEYLKGDKKND